VCCLLCFDDSPFPNDARASRSGTFQISMFDALYKNQPICLLTYFFPCCFAYYTRYKALDSDLKRYSCCQGYMDVCCFKAGMFDEKSCPSFCLFVESFLCLGPSISSSRQFVMDQYDLRPDPFDNQLIRFNNCLAMLSCFCDILSIFHRDLRHLSHTIDLISKCVFYSTVGCMTSQVLAELNYRRDSSMNYHTMSPHEGDFIDVSPILGEAYVIKNDKDVTVL